VIGNIWHGITAPYKNTGGTVTIIDVGTGVSDALNTNVGTAGSFTVNGGAGVFSSLRVNQAPSVIGTGVKTISNAADGSTNFGHYISFNLNGIAYYIPCSSVAPT
jgi:hypothetical protein